VVEDLDCGGDENPASRTDVGLGAATADGIIICHVDIKHELALEWFESGRPHGFLISWLHGAWAIRGLLSEARWVGGIDTTHPRAVHGTNLKPSRIEGTNLLL